MYEIKCVIDHERGAKVNHAIDELSPSITKMSYPFFGHEHITIYRLQLSQLTGAGAQSL
jgi:hypothetical protein